MKRGFGPLQPKKLGFNDCLVGIRLHGADGRQMPKFTSGQMISLLGHSHPNRLVRAGVCLVSYRDRETGNQSQSQITEGRTNNLELLAPDKAVINRSHLTLAGLVFLRRPSIYTYSSVSWECALIKNSISTQAGPFFSMQSHKRFRSEQKDDAYHSQVPATSPAMPHHHCP